MKTNEAVEVTQADRDCARDVVNALHIGIGGVAELIARHRIASVAAACPLIMEEAAGIAKTGWLTADYDVVGIADADMAMRLCEHIESQLRTAAKTDGGGA